MIVLFGKKCGQKDVFCNVVVVDITETLLNYVFLISKIIIIFAEENYKQ